MHIVVREKDGKTRNIRLPNGLVLNRLTAKIAEKAIEKNAEEGVRITSAQLMVLFREMKRSKRLLSERGLHFVEVSERGGDYVLVDF